MCGQIIAKPFRKNYFDREIERLVIFTNKISKSDTEEDSAIEAFPFMSELIKKRRDIRVNIFGEEIISTSIGGDPFAEDVLDWRKNALEMKHEAMLLPSDIETKCIRLVKSYGLNYCIGSCRKLGR